VWLRAGGTPAYNLCIHSGVWTGVETMEKSGRITTGTLWSTPRGGALPPYLLLLGAPLQFSVPSYISSNTPSGPLESPIASATAPILHLHTFGAPNRLHTHPNPPIHAPGGPLELQPHSTHPHHSNSTPLEPQPDSTHTQHSSSTPLEFHHRKRTLVEPPFSCTVPRPPATWQCKLAVHSGLPAGPLLLLRWLTGWRKT
jgi:hypothetical protein